MPVTLPIVDHPAKVWKTPKCKRGDGILETINEQQFQNYKEILRTSFDKDALSRAHITPAKNGLVHAAMEAYSRHHHFTIRPEDVWFGILTQISFYINAHAEELRNLFVAHEGQKHLKVEMFGNRYTVDFGDFAQQMADLIGDNVKDPRLRDWVMPDFSTTTDTDRAVGGVLFMGAMQSYFSYECMICCGLPSVTLLGEAADYEAILPRLDMLECFGAEPTILASLLRPVLEHMILSFTEGATPRVVSFWNKIAHHNDVGSGTPYLSGWITAFCFWSAEGKMSGRIPGPGDDESSWDSDWDLAGEHEEPEWTLGNVNFPFVNIPDIPSGSASVPVLVDDNGVKFMCTMVAGSAAIRASSPTEEQHAAVSRIKFMKHEKAAIQPMSGWFICINKKQN